MNWHEKYREKRTFGERLADNVAATMGSWKFIIIQTIVVAVWVGINIVGILYEWDKYPFILLNLVFSTQAAYAAPIIMMSQNRQNAKERVKAEEDYETNKASKIEIEMLIKTLDRLEREKLNRIMEKFNIIEEGIEDSEDMYKTAQKFYPGFHESTERTAFIKGAIWRKRFKQ